MPSDYTYLNGNNTSIKSDYAIDYYALYLTRKFVNDETWSIYV